MLVLLIFHINTANSGSLMLYFCTLVLRHVYVDCKYEVRKYHYMCETVGSMYAAIETH